MRHILLILTILYSTGSIAQVPGGTTTIRLTSEGISEADIHDLVKRYMSDMNYSVVEENGDMEIEVIARIENANEDGDCPFRVIVRLRNTPKDGRRSTFFLEQMEHDVYLGNRLAVFELIEYYLYKVKQYYADQLYEKRTNFETVTLMEATPVRLRVLTRLSPRTHVVGSEVPLKVVRDVVVDGYVLLSAGTFVEGVVTNSEPANALGRGAGLSFEVPMIWSVAGQPVPVASRTSYAAGKSNVGGAIAAAGVLDQMGLGTFGLLVRGGDAVIPAGSEYMMYVTKDRNLYIE